MPSGVIPIGLETIQLPADATLFERLAGVLMERCRGGAGEAPGHPLAECDLVLPSLGLARPLRVALAAHAGGALFMPRLLTPTLLAARWQGGMPVDPYARRLLRLVAQLRQHAWLGEADPWPVAHELLGLADALAELPALDDGQLLQQCFERAHALSGSPALSLEARLAHAVWQSDCTGTPGQARATVQALMRAAHAARRPLFYLSSALEPPPAWLDVYAGRARVLHIRAARPCVETPVARVLAAAWPAGAPAALPSQAEVVSIEDARLVAGRVRLVGVQSLEHEAQHAAQCIVGWLAEGRRDIALVALDREAARRARALLERRQVLLADETGWKLSTTRAAAMVDAFLQCLASDGYFRDLLDLVRSPHIAGVLDRDDHARAIAAIDDWVVARNHVDGLHALLTDAARAFSGGPAGRLIDALARAFALMPTHEAPAAFRVERLLAALDALGARAALMADAAGAQVVGLLEQLRADSMGVALDLSFSDWRKWLNGAFEQALFRDSAIDSPVVLTPLAATRLRRFDGAYVIGADREHLAPPRLHGVLGHEGVRRELGLPDTAHAALQLRDDLAGLIACSDETVFSWQTQRNGEACLPGLDLQRLDLVLQRAGLPSAMHMAPLLADPPPLPPLSALSAPVLEAARVPQRLTASGLADLMACPYRYYARHVLGLGAGDEVEESMGKGRIGELVHRVLHDFHVMHPRLSGIEPEARVGALRACIAAAFDEAIARNFQEHAWADRLLDRAQAYIDWALQREASGWLFRSGEQRRAHALELPDGVPLSLEGRIDRIDHDAAGRRALLDYKLRSADSVKKSLQGDDVQLAFYTLLEGEAASETVSEAAYLALDEVAPVACAQPEPQHAAESLRSLVAVVFPALRGGAALPAQGDEAACRYCDMRGLCRRDWLP
jgi:ATP-dependent helicase/nuclease subunit B